MFCQNNFRKKIFTVHRLEHYIAKIYCQNFAVSLNSRSAELVRLTFFRNFSLENVFLMVFDSFAKNFGPTFKAYYQKNCGVIYLSWSTKLARPTFLICVQKSFPNVPEVFSQNNGGGSPKCGHMPSELGYIYYELSPKNYKVPGTFATKKFSKSIFSFENTF